MQTKKSLSFRIHGMDCAEEVAVLKRELGPITGGEANLSFDILRGKMSIFADLSPDLVMRSVARTGMRAEPWLDPNEPSQKSRATLWEGRARPMLTAMSALFTFAGFLLHAFLAGGMGQALGSEGLGATHDVPLPAIVLYLLGIASGSWYVVPKAWYAVKRRTPDMNLLMTVAVIGAAIIGEWFEASTVSFLFALSLVLESWSVGRARRAVEALLDLAPPTVRLLLPAGGQKEVRPEEVSLGSLFLVKPGERIPLDGTVAKGQSHVNQAPITGESAPVAKEVGATVFAGTVNGDGAIEVSSTKLAGDTTLAHIIRLVGEAQAKRAPSEQWVERFARIYTPAVFALAILTAGIPPLLFGGDWPAWLYRALVLLVIGCPCALVISTPVSIVSALAAAARNGVLIKGGLYVETPAHLKAIAMDKTGTLTVGRPGVVEVRSVGGQPQSQVLEIAAAMEAQSDHPLARAIVAHAEEQGLKPRIVEDFQALQGRGATARLDGKEYWLGSHRYLEERGLETEEIHDELERLSNAGQSVVVLGDFSQVLGFITLSDQVRPESRGTIDQLRRNGIDRVVMLTGDNKPTAEAIARETGVDEVLAELLPEDKVTAIQDLVRKYGAVAMVGDGINDAPAMAQATLGIAMGAAGSDAAIETADIALMSDDLSKLPWLIRHARRSLTVIRQNIALSLAVKAIFVVLTFAGGASLWAAIAADMGVSLLVIFNALRLLGRR